MRKILPAVFCAFLLIAAAYAEEDAEVAVRPVPDAWSSEVMLPLKIDARSKTGGTLRLEFSSYGNSMRHIHSVEIAPGAPVRIDIAAFSAPYLRLEWFLGAERGTAYAAGHSYYRGRDTPPILAVNATLLRELERAAQDAGGDRVLSSIPAEELPTDWRAYVGLSAHIVMSGEDARRLTPAQTQALDRWVDWFGGRVKLVGEGAAADALYGDATPVPGIFDPGGIGEDSNLLEGLGEVPVSFIVLSLVILGILLGPVTWFIVSRKRNPLLFFVIVPVIALCGTACIMGGAFLIEGSDVQYNQVALLVRREGGTDAMFYDFRGVRPGLLMPEVKFNSDTLALPFSDNRAEKIFDSTDGAALVSGWIQPRFAAGYLTVRPVACRMTVDIEPDGGGYRAVNNLGFPVKQLAVRLPGGTFGHAENIPAGGSAALTPAGPQRHSGLVRRLLSLSGFRRSAIPDPVLVAETEGLPYADDGGLGGMPRETVFFHVVAGKGGEER